MKNIETKIRTGISNGIFGSERGSFEYDAETSRLLDLTDSCHEIEVFSHENRIYLGNRTNAVKLYIKNNPEPSDFGVWLQDNYKQLNP